MGDHRSRDSGELPDKFELRVTAPPERLDELFRRFTVDVGCRHPHSERNDDGTLTVLFYASEQLIGEIEAAGYSVTRGENLSAIGRDRQGEIGKGDRFGRGRTHPEGLGSLDRDRPARNAS
jgi:hypothetical protein